MLRSGVGFQGGFELTMAFNQPVSDRVVGRSMNPLASKEAGQLRPQGRLKLMTTIGGDHRRHPKSSNPAVHKSLCNCFCCDRGNWYGFRPPCESVDTRE